jgi:hypothetical protein
VLSFRQVVVVKIAPEIIDPVKKTVSASSLEKNERDEGTNASLPAIVGSPPSSESLNTIHVGRAQRFGSEATLRVDLASDLTSASGLNAAPTGSPRARLIEGVTPARLDLVKSKQLTPIPLSRSTSTELLFASKASPGDNRLSAAMQRNAAPMAGTVSSAKRWAEPPQPSSPVGDGPSSRWTDGGAKSPNHRESAFIPLASPSATVLPPTVLALFREYVTAHQYELAAAVGLQSGACLHAAISYAITTYIAGIEARLAIRPATPTASSDPASTNAPLHRDDANMLAARMDVWKSAWKKATAEYGVRLLGTCARGSIERSVCI